jgi:uncharacterized ferredoxin-like protein
MATRTKQKMKGANLMKTTSNYTEDAKKLAELMSTLTEEDKKIVMIYAGALRDRAALTKKDPDNLEAS